MKSYESYMFELNTIDIEIKRLNDHLKNMRLQRSNILGYLYRYMSSNDLTKLSYGNKELTIKQCAPREKRAPTKPKKERERDAIEMLRDIGIPDPVQFYNDLESTRKLERPSITNDNPEPTCKRGGKSKNKNEYDPSLGF